MKQITKKFAIWLCLNLFVFVCGLLLNTQFESIQIPLVLFMAITFFLCTYTLWKDNLNLLIFKKRKGSFLLLFFSLSITVTLLTASFYNSLFYISYNEQTTFSKRFFSLFNADELKNVAISSIIEKVYKNKKKITIEKNAYFYTTENEKESITLIQKTISDFQSSIPTFLITKVVYPLSIFVVPYNETNIISGGISDVIINGSYFDGHQALLLVDMDSYLKEPGNKNRDYKETILHEYSHYLIDIKLKELGMQPSSLPQWMNEGLQRYVIGKYTTLLTDVGDTGDIVINYNFLTTSTGWIKGVSKGYDPYPVSMYMVNKIIDSIGEDGIISLLEESKNTNFEVAFKKMIGKDIEIFFER